MNKYLLLLMATAISFSATAQNEELWYKQPAREWTDALPIGNGRLGAMIYGTTESEHVQFNEETLWTGKPREHNQKGASAYLSKIRQLLNEGKQADAEKLAAEHFMGLKSEPGDQKSWFERMKAGEGIEGNPALVNYKDKDWETMTVPSYEGWEAVGFEGMDGAVWFRHTFNIPADWKGKDLVLSLNKIRDQDFTYINGTLVGSTNGTNESRVYTVPAKALKTGQNVIAIQVLNYSDKGGIAGYKDTSRHISIYPKGGDEKSGVSLNGQWKYKIQNDLPPAVAEYEASYQPFGDLYLNFKGHGEVTNYKRSLDLQKAIATTTYSVNGTKYQRSYFASQPNQAVVIRLEADKKKSISFDALLKSAHKRYVVKKIDEQTLALYVQVRNGVLKGESRLRVVANGGKVKVSNEGISIQKADDVVLYLTAGTNYVNYHDVSGNPAEACVKALNSLQDLNYEEVLNKHIREYQSYYSAFSVNFGKSPNEALPTDERLKAFGKSKDAAFAALYMQYGRYLLISSSRPGTMPANLQGIWNNLLSPPWGSKYTLNINAEMNYWPAELLNLSALHEPFFRMTEEVAQQGEKTAQWYYGADGWAVHHNTDIWRATAPINNSNHGIWQGGAGWMSQHLWEHFSFTGDTAFLRTRAYPLMKGAAKFYIDILVEDPKTGWLISSPSNSPENGGLVAGPTMDHQIIRTLFRNCIAAAEILGRDESFVKELKEKLGRIAPNQIGRHGQLQEWMQDIDDPENTHRHVSHLWGVYPGSEINWKETPQIMKAAEQSLIFRGDEATGWSLAWKINFWARFKDAEHAWHMVHMLLSPADKSGGSYVNLFDAHPPFQIDGNFGGAAGIGEMLIQSHTEIIELLPALPKDISQGEVKGICARGAFQLDLSWENGNLTRVKVLSKAGGPCKLKYGNKEVSLNTQKGKGYTLNGDLVVQ